MKCRKFTAATLSAAMLFSLSGCIPKAKAVDLMEGMTPQTVSGTTDLANGSAAVTDFALRLFQASMEDGKNTLISPLSVMYALSMTANGAKGETLSQMETALGMDTASLNNYLYTYRNMSAQNGADKMHIANSIWFSDNQHFTVDANFLQTNANYYGADLYKAPFDDRTCKEINNWVKTETEGMIPKIIDSIPTDAVMYLVNAVAFEAEWASVYKETQVDEDTFTKEDGSTETVDMMYSKESRYLEDDNATGFLKYYQGNRYAFAALLPNKGVTVSEYVASLDSKALYAMLAAPTVHTVEAAIPKFETEYSTDMAAILSAMGMSDAFDGQVADFSGLGTSVAGNIAIHRVLHKTYISVAEQGTKAGAATAVEMNMTSAEYIENQPKIVYLDRPFVYMLIDCETNTPFFMGTMMDVKQ